MNRYIYLKQRWAQGYWKINLTPAGSHSAQNCNVSTWIMFSAFGGKTPSQATSTQVSHIFTAYECCRVTFNRLPKTWQRKFNEVKP